MRGRGYMIRISEATGSPKRQENKNLEHSSAGVESDLYTIRNAHA
jgi:hypothetical protein